MKKILKFYYPYLKRNKTFDKFIFDVNTLGGTFGKGFIDTNKTHSMIQDKDSNIIKKIPLKEIWEKHNQLKVYENN